MFIERAEHVRGDTDRIKGQNSSLSLHSRQIETDSLKTDIMRGDTSRTASAYSGSLSA